MKASKLRHRITIQKATRTKNKVGEVVTAWATHATVWANFTPLSVKEVIQAQAVGNKTTARCVIRYRNDITSGMQVINNGITYAITGQPLADAGSGKEYLTLMLSSI